MRKKMTLAKWGGVSGVVVMLLVLVAHSHHTTSTDKPARAASPTSPLVHATNSEEVRYLTAEVDTVIAQNKQLRQDNEAVKARLKHSTNDKMFAQQQANHQLLATQQQALAALRHELTRLKNTPVKTVAATPDTHHGYAVNGEATVLPAESAMITQVTDLAAPPTPDKSGHGTPSILPTVPVASSAKAAATKAPKATPYFTLPANATLGDVVLQTDLIGEVPVNHTLLAPAFKFKAIVGRDQLMASNGLTLPPDLNGIVFEGYSVGNMALSCARGYITRLLFTWSDGTFTVIGGTQTGSSLKPTDTLGYLTTPYGNPCLPGQYLTDAPKVLASMAAFSGASGWAKALSQAETTTQSSSYGSMTEVTGNANKYAGGKAIGQGADSALAWYTSRVSDVFDVVYIPASQHQTPTRVVVNLTQTIAIDKPTHGRKLDYGQTHQNVLAHRTLD